MKKLTAFILATMIVLSLAACGNEANMAGNTEPPQNGTEAPRTEAPADTNNENDAPGEPTDSAGEPDTPPEDVPSEPEQEPTGGKILVAYFSATNNTEGIAQKLSDGLGADLYEITPAEPYTDADLNYGDSKSRTSVEMDDPSARPEISGAVENMEQYDVVFIGYPIWWGEAPRIMSTFIESYDFSGKTLVAFCTSGSSGFGSSDSALRAAASGATWLDGHRFSAGASADDVMDWANGLGIS